MVRCSKQWRPSITWIHPRRTRSLGDSRSMRSPRNAIEPFVTSPRSALRILDTALRVVVFPAPFAPRSVTIPPSGSSSDTPFRTRDDVVVDNLDVVDAQHRIGCAGLFRRSHRATLLSPVAVSSAAFAYANVPRPPGRTSGRRGVSDVSLRSQDAPWPDSVRCSSPASYSRTSPLQAPPPFPASAGPRRQADRYRSEPCATRTHPIPGSRPDRCSRGPRRRS